MCCEVKGLKLHSLVMLSAGFDYNGDLTQILPEMSFGGVEVGSITAKAYKGNPKPRLTRLIKSKSLLVNKGLKNIGVEAFIRHFKSLKKPTGAFVIGVSIAKTNNEEVCTLDAGVADYTTSFSRLVAEDIGDFYTINISCPNAFGGENFAEASRLEVLLQSLSEVPNAKPLFIKMPINLTKEEYILLCDVAAKYLVDGLIIGNLNKNYEVLTHRDEAPKDFSGGINGLPCAKPSTELIRLTKSRYQDRFILVGCGGVLSVKDAEEKWDAGADVLQMITGMIFEGSHLMKAITKAWKIRQQKIK